MVMRRVLGIIVVGAVLGLGTGRAGAGPRGRAVLGVLPGQRLLRVARDVRDELRLRQLRHPEDLYLVLGVSRSLLRFQLSRLRVPPRPLRRRPLAARVRRAGYVYGQPTSADSYRTFPVVQGTGLTADQIAPPPSIGVYAPALGPGIGLYGR